MRSLIFAALLSLSTSCSPDPEPSCVVLQDYYDDCCYTCGRGDSYCAFYDLEESEAFCAAEIQDWGDLSTCTCD